MTEVLTTIDHDFIRSWAEGRGGRPARARGVDGSDHSGILRISFDGLDRENLQPISWDVFFEVFEESGLAFAYEPRAGSRVFRLVRRDFAAQGPSNR